MIPPRMPGQHHAAEGEQERAARREHRRALGSVRVGIPGSGPSAIGRWYGHAGARNHVAGRLARDARPRGAADLQRDREHRGGAATHPRARCPTPTSWWSTTAAPTAPPTWPRSSATSSGGIEVLRRPAKSGLGSAYRAGFRVGLARGYDVMVEMDADLSHDPAVLPDARRARSSRAPTSRSGRATCRADRSPTGSSAPARHLARSAASTRGPCSGCRCTTPPPGSGPTTAGSLSPDRPRPRPRRRLRLPGRDDLPQPSAAGGRIVEVPIEFRDRTPRALEDVEPDRRRGACAGHVVGRPRPRRRSAARYEGLRARH